MGFAVRGVIEERVGEKLREDLERGELLVDDGELDGVVDGDDMRE